MRVNCSWVSVKLHLSYTVASYCLAKVVLENLMLPYKVSLHIQPQNHQKIVKSIKTVAIVVKSNDVVVLLINYCDVSQYWYYRSALVKIPYSRKVGEFGEPSVICQTKTIQFCSCTENLLADLFICQTFFVRHSEKEIHWTFCSPNIPVIWYYVCIIAPLAMYKAT